LQVVLLELNEVNFDHLRLYAARGRLPNLASLIERHGVVETTSEQGGEELEPWIQWVTAHTGLALKDHCVFRLGDIVTRDIAQIWEVLEERGLRVGAICPMNAKNRTQDAAFFVPDPWTATEATAPTLLKRMHSAIRQIVNDNAQARISFASAAWLGVGALRYARITNYPYYAALIAAARRKPWVKAMFLDLLLSDVFVGEVCRRKPHFSSLFLNAAAHIQHHYMFNSIAYTGGQRNPNWYIDDEQDPVGEIYEVYDRIVGEIRRRCRGSRLMIATGLHQDPHSSVTFYWRLRDHAAFLQKLQAPFMRVAALMSRDFIVECASATDAAQTAAILASAQDQAGGRLFEVDNRGRDLFVMLTWSRDISPDFVYTANGRRFAGLRDDVAFVAIKNGEHNGVGYFIDTGLTNNHRERPFPLKDLPMRICAALEVQW
jgi:hypothetical protein